MGSAERRDRVGELLDIVELGDVASRLPETLSGGQQQRVALARSLAPRPSVLLLDEPFSALDASLRVQVRGDVGRILREIGVTTIFVTHDQDEAFVLGDSVAVMRDGRIEQVGTPDELYRTPASPWVAAFVGEANFVAGRFADADSADSDHHGNEIPAGHARTLLGSVPVISPGNLEAGGDVTVLIRPEQIALRTGDCAEIVNVEYYGHDVRYELRLHDGSTLAARTKATDLHERGETVCVHFSGAATEAWSAEVATAGQNPLPNG
jgi:ABC-type Fe3+/spermidine/putrescine transport system ATPase subunit